MPRLLALVLVLATACTPSAAAPKDPELPEVAAFRAALADPAQHPFRKGLELDDVQLKAAVAKFRDEHRDLLARTFEASLDALPAGTLPGDGYGSVATTTPDQGAQILEPTQFMYTFTPDASRLARTAISMFAPHLAMNAGMPVSKVGAWVGFFGSATPAVRRCERGAESATVCLDYGGLDVFVITLVKQGGAWGVNGVAWRQKGRTAAK